MELISEFVFCETDRRGNRRGLNPLQELQLIDIICDYISGCTNETTKNTIFLSLFGGMESQRKLKVLSILASMAVSASSTPVSSIFYKFFSYVTYLKILDRLSACYTFLVIIKKTLYNILI